MTPPSRPHSHSHKATEVLDHQSDLLHYWESPEGQRFARNFVTAEDKSTIKVYRSDDREEDVRAFLRDERARLLHCTPYWVSKDMVSLATSASRSFPMKPLTIDDLPAAIGFMWFDAPFHIRDVNKRIMSIKAISWGAAPFHVLAGMQKFDAVYGGVAICFYSDRDDPKDEYSTELRDEGIHTSSRLQLSHITGVPFNMVRTETGGWSLPAKIGEGVYEPGQDMEFRAFDTSHDEERGEGLDWQDDFALEGQLRLLETVFTLIQQPIWRPKSMIDTGWTSPDRPGRKRAERAGLNPSVVVVTLRRIAHGTRDEGEGEGQGRTYTVRWMVRAHWRMQWFPSQNTHHRILIEEHIKGPDGAPLVVRDKVMAWRR